MGKKGEEDTIESSATFNNKRLCTVVRGHYGFAVVHYQISSATYEAFVTVKLYSTKGGNSIVSGFVEGELLIRYLGVPITTGRLRNKDCTTLIDRIVDRIRSLGAKKLTYAGMLTLVQAVLSSMNYIWEGHSEYNRVPLIAWEKVCVPKEEGGLGLRTSYVWNNALIGKIVWWLAVKPDKLWVQWVNHIYLKGVHWSNYVLSGDVSWQWKRIYKIISSVKVGFDND
ncbi:uncharacterized protein LOC141632879 [Silene latifolia]|uniref:uncharacterized protein LOC141632879 n=1 Tax=Silene latifolia TaxID=37657 RepID=UPI003D76E1C9